MQSSRWGESSGKKRQVVGEWMQHFQINIKDSSKYYILPTTPTGERVGTKLAWVGLVILSANGYITSAKDLTYLGLGMAHNMTRVCSSMLGNPTLTYRTKGRGTSVMKVNSVIGNSEMNTFW